MLPPHCSMSAVDAWIAETDLSQDDPDAIMAVIEVCFLGSFDGMPMTTSLSELAVSAAVGHISNAGTATRQNSLRQLNVAATP